MTHEDLAARVAEIRARHAEYPPPEWSEVAILLAALTVAEAERDDARDAARTSVAYFTEKIVAAEQRATRLAALEAAARRLAGHHGPVHCNCQTCKQFRAAVANLAAPPGESP